MKTPWYMPLSRKMSCSDPAHSVVQFKGKFSSADVEVLIRRVDCVPVVHAVAHVGEVETAYAIIAAVSVMQE